MSSQISLTVLTFIGLIVGSIGGLISLLTKTSVEVGGTTRKQLTTSGKWALAISMVGFSGSFASEVLKSSIHAQEQAQAKLEASVKKEKEIEEAQWRSRSAELEAKILNNTNDALAQSEENLRSTIEGFEREQEGILKTRLDIAASQQKVLSDNLTHETRLYGRLSAAGTPLINTTIKLTVEHVPHEVLENLLQGIKDAQSSTAEDWYEDLNIHHNVSYDDDQLLEQSVMYQQVILPFINWLGANQFRKDLVTRQGSIAWRDEDQALQEQGMLVLSLGDRFSTLVCVGWVSKPDIFSMEKSETDTAESGSSLLPSGVLIGDEIQWHISYAHPKFPYSRKKASRPRVSLQVVKDSVVLTVELDQLSLDDSLLRYGKNSSMTAALPDTVELFSWRPSSDEKESVYGYPTELPFDSMKVHDSVPALDLLKPEHPSQIPIWKRHLRLQIIPNGVEQISKTYHLSLSSDGEIYEGPRDDDPRGYVRLWHGHAR
jgi:hypothetical protein